MSKRQTPIQRMVGFGMGATEPELQQAIEMLTMLRNERFPKPQKAKATSKTRKPRVSKDTTPANGAATLEGPNPPPLD